MNRFFHHDYTNEQGKGLRDILFASLDALSSVLCALLIISPPKWWYLLAPFSLPLLLLIFILISMVILKSYWTSQLLNTKGYFFIQNTTTDTAPERLSAHLGSQEYAPIAFLFGLFTKFGVRIIILSVKKMLSMPQELDANSLTLSGFIGVFAGALVMLIAYIKTSPQASKTRQ